ncbi:MAG: DUF1294 domain-containing protein [Erysipelotrichaceae bacterium]|nr:DUF1294 domain-containing protein [Erysipelotrichaceae bacterium]
MNFILYLISINFVAFFLCYFDKKKAIHHQWRIAESTLLIISFMGGCFGMMFGMYLFHHKTRKIKFKLVYICCIIWIFFFLLENT